MAAWQQRAQRTTGRFRLDTAAWLARFFFAPMATLGRRTIDAVLNEASAIRVRR